VRIPAALITTMLALTAAATAAQTTATRPAIEVQTGEQKVLEPGFAIGNIAIANPDICDFRVLPERRAVLLVPAREGHTTLTFWDQQGRKRDEFPIEVLSRETVKLKNDLAALLRPYPGVEIRTLGSRLTLTGVVDTPAQLQQVQAIASASSVSSIVSVGPRATGAGPVVVPVLPDPSMVVPPPPSTTTATSPPIVVPTEPPSRTTLPPPPATRVVPVAPVTDAASAGARGPAARTAMPSRVEYDVELIQLTASAPPPDVVAPHGVSLFRGRLAAAAGAPARQLLGVNRGALQPQSASDASASIVGLSVAVEPAIDDAGVVRTRLVVDTNLPLGLADPSAPPRWRRAQIDVRGAAGQTQYVTEQDLARAFASADAAAPPAAGAPASAEYVEAVAALPLFAGRGRTVSTAASPSVLVIAVTPARARDYEN